MSGGHFPEPWEDGVLRYVSKVERCLGISLSLECQNRIRSGFHSPSNSPGEMHAKKRKLRIRDGVDQTLHKVLLVWRDLVVLSTKGHDGWISSGICQTPDPITLQTGTVDH